MLAQFRHHYPQGSMVSELVDLDRGLYLVKVTIRVSGEILATGLAAAERVELAEDRARKRALAVLALDEIPVTKEIGASQTPAKPATMSSNSELSNSDRAITSPVPVTTENKSTSQEDYVVRELSQSQQSDLVSAEEFHQAIATSEPQSDLTSPSPEETPSIENGNLFAGTLESQSPGESVLNLEQPQQPPIADSEPVSSNTTIEVNFDDIKHQTDIHIKRLGWTKEDGVNFLKVAMENVAVFILKMRNCLSS